MESHSSKIVAAVLRSMACDAVLGLPIQPVTGYKGTVDIRLEVNSCARLKGRG